MTVSPADGLLVVPFVMVPVMVLAAKAEKGSATKQIAAKERRKRWRRSIPISLSLEVVNLPFTGTILKLEAIP